MLQSSEHFASMLLILLLFPLLISSQTIENKKGPKNIVSCFCQILRSLIFSSRRGESEYYSTSAEEALKFKV